MSEKLYEEIKKNLRNPKMYAVLLIVLMIVFLLFPYLDANLFYYKRVDDRVEILSELSNLDMDAINHNPVLLGEYESILKELESHPESSINQIFVKETRVSVNAAKFVSGAILVWLLAISCLFMKTIDKKWNRVVAFVILVLLGLLFGKVAKSIPNIFNPWVNVIGFPIVLVTSIGLLFVGSGNKKEESKKNQEKS